MKEYDLVICQRLTNYDLCKFITDAAFLHGIPVVLETDDDYLHLSPGNPCYYGTNLNSELLDFARECQRNGEMEKLQGLMPQLEADRLAGLESYKRAIKLFDAVTVTTPELRATLLPYNKNVEVFGNNIEHVHWHKDHSLEQSTKDGKLVSKNLMGMYTVPSFFPERDPQNFEPILQDGQMQIKRIYRVGYACTSSHMQDWSTVHEPWNSLINKWGDKAHFIYMGDPWFYKTQKAFTGGKHDKHTPECAGYVNEGYATGCNLNPEGDGRQNRRIHIPESTVPMYLLNSRALDCFIAPLEPTIFNMSKSDLKALEGASWGACPVLPDYVTYARFWEHGKTAMLYKNQREFVEILDYLLTNPAVMEQIGRNARQYVYEERLEKHHAERRFNFYKSIIESKKRLVPITPNKVSK
jgi:glycosyltransferase involved in cell wall biosynthesis